MFKRFSQENSQSAEPPYAPEKRGLEQIITLGILDTGQKTEIENMLTVGRQNKFSKKKSVNYLIVPV